MDSADVALVSGGSVDTTSIGAVCGAVSMPGWFAGRGESSPNLVDVSNVTTETPRSELLDALAPAGERLLFRGRAARTGGAGALLASLLCRTTRLVQAGNVFTDKSWWLDFVVC